MLDVNNINQAGGQIPGTSRRYDLGKGESRLDKKTFPIWHYGVVTDIDDPNDAGRIKVRVTSIDYDILDDEESSSTLNKQQTTYELPWCEPLLPKFINVVPKVGEMVKIITFDYRNKKLRRQYIGPVIGQQTPVDFFNSNYNEANLKVENKAYSSSWSQNGEAIDGVWKIYPDKTDVAILGRKNTDFILRDNNFYNEIVLRAGKIDPKTLDQRGTDTSPYILNKKNPGYISINFTQANALPNSVNNSVKTLNLQNDRSHINFVADKINLISHLGSTKKGEAPKILKGNDIFTQINVENNKLHPVVYGDVLWEFLTKLRSYVEGHIHKGSRREPDGDTTKNDLIQWFNENMGNQVSKKNPDGTDYLDLENCRFLSRGVRTN